ncbi:hypothetical protein Mapa_011040 [Marchantia paleacea]|nr:hypothetical protein Mapa_011040 [Marchantia paleacea]
MYHHWSTGREFSLQLSCFLMAGTSVTNLLRDVFTIHCLFFIRTLVASGPLRSSSMVNILVLFIESEVYLIQEALECLDHVRLSFISQLGDCSGKNKSILER